MIIPVIFFVVVLILTALRNTIGARFDFKSGIWQIMLCGALPVYCLIPLKLHENDMCPGQV